MEFSSSPLDTLWFWQIATVLVVIIAINVAAYFLLRHIEKIADATDSIWDDAFIKAARRPVTLLLWTLGAAIGLRIIHQHIGVPYFDLVEPTRNVLIIVALTWLLLGLIRNAADNASALRLVREESIDRTTVDALSKLGRISVLIVAILTILQTLGVSIAGVLAFGGIGGIAIGFAAKDLFANLLGGLTVYLDRPFTVGEWVRSPNQNIEGVVEHIGWRHTRIRAFNKNPVYVPNALFTTIIVENPSRMSHRRIKETIGLRYSDLDKIAVIVAEVKSMLQNHADIDQDATLIVNFNAFGDSSLDFFIYAFTLTRDWATYHAIKQDVLLQIADIIQRHGAQIAYPTRTLHVEAEEQLDNPPVPAPDTSPT